MTTLVWRTDVHMADFSPQSRTDDWTETLLGKLSQVGHIAEEVKADAVIDGGDLFHVKSPSRNSHELVGKVASIHNTYPCPVYGTIGNHDVKYGSMEFLQESPLGVLFHTGNMRRLYGIHEAIFTDGNITVRVVGIPYHGTSYDMELFRKIKKGSEDYLVVAAHVLASPKGGTLFESEDVVSYHFLGDLEPDVWLLGHWHKNQGIVEQNGKWIVNIGSLSRGSLSQDDINRIPACAVLKFDSEGIDIQAIPLEVKPASEVFNLQGKARADAKSMSMDVFVDSLKDSLMTQSGDSLIDQIRDMPGVDNQVREKALLYLEQVK